MEPKVDGHAQVAACVRKRAVDGLAKLEARGEMTDGSNYIFIKSQHPEDDELYDAITSFPKRCQVSFLRN